MAKVYAIAIRMRCSECGETNATGLAWARHQQAFAYLRRQTEPYC